MKKLFNKTVAIIPAYLPKDDFYSYVSELLQFGVEQVLVIDDGSGKKSEQLFKKIALLKCVTVLSYPYNRGKGYALKYAYKYAAEHYDPSYTFVCCDCDGQHRHTDVLRVLNAAIETPDKIVLGARDFSHSDVPYRSKMGNIVTRWCFKSLYHLSLMDTQTGLRAFSYRFLKELIAISGNRFEYEMNALIILYKNGVNFREIPIETVYANNIKGKNSHFKTVKDSLSIFLVLFKSIGWYFVSALVSAAIDVGVFYLLYNYVFTLNGSLLRMILPAVIARVLSSIVNFTINFKFVFRSKSKFAIFKYYLLWSLQLILSCISVYFLTLIFTESIYVTVFKAVIDFIFALISYKIQSKWVFKTKSDMHLNFYGSFLRINRLIFNIFSKKYTSFVNPDRTSAAIYIARHENLKGPIKLTQSLNFDLHTFAYFPFFNFSTCYRQYATYTFTKRYGIRGIRAILAKIPAFFAAIYVPFLVKSAKAIPVYRTNLKSVITYKKALKHLLDGESVAIFPDVDYTGNGKSDEMYKGFAYLDRLYFNSYGKHLDFIVLDIDHKQRQIREHSRHKIMNGQSYFAQMDTLAEQIRQDLLR